MARGDHIYVYRYFPGLQYTHHGIDCGDGTVIHYSEEIIEQIAIQEFSQGTKIHKRLYEYCDSTDLVMLRAKSRLGERKYHLIFNNCEHFASWCKTGIEESEQVKNPVLNFLSDFFQWRMQDRERQHYEDLIARHNYIIRQLNHQLGHTESIAPKTLQYNVVYQTENGVNKKSLESPLITDKFNYQILQGLLKEGCWQEADELTSYVMLKIINRENDRYFRRIDIANFPREHLLIIDKLWRDNSRNSFGFSIQKKIYQNLGGNQNYEYDTWEKFSEYVGWRVNDIPLSYEQLNFSMKAPKGHLPNGKKIGSEIIGFLAII